METRWRAVPGWPYEVSDDGLVRRSEPGKGTRVGKILRAGISGKGYRYVHLSRGGVVWEVSVHSLVATAFIGDRPDGLGINHKDGNKTDNTWTNLEYSTQGENVAHATRTGLQPIHEHHPNAKLNWALVHEIHAAVAAGETKRAIARRIGVTESAVRKVAKGKRWRVAEAS